MQTRYARHSTVDARQHMQMQDANASQGEDSAFPKVITSLVDTRTRACVCVCVCAPPPSLSLSRVTAVRASGAPLRRRRMRHASRAPHSTACKYRSCMGGCSTSRSACTDHAPLVLRLPVDALMLSAALNVPSMCSRRHRPVPSDKHVSAQSFSMIRHLGHRRQGRTRSSPETLCSRRLRTLPYRKLFSQGLPQPTDPNFAVC